ncbi:MAG: hypothetical protein AAF802_19470 [Planctomycetota bacterium]
MKSEPNPYAVPSNWDGESLVAVPLKAGNPKTWIDVSLLVIIAATCVIGSLLSLEQIEVIVPSGIALSVFGILLTAREVYVRRRRSAWHAGLVFGICGPLFSAIVFGTIFLNGWGPGDARRNGVAYACLVFAILMCVFFVIALRQLKTRKQLELNSLEHEAAEAHADLDPLTDNRAKRS